MIIEEIIIKYLTERLEVPVSAEVPAELPAAFVTVEKTSGGVRDFVANGTVAIRSRSAASKLDAAQLNEEVKAAMIGLPEVDAVTGCHLNSDYDYPDPGRNMYGYQAVYDVNFYD